MAGKNLIHALRAQLLWEPGITQVPEPRVFHLSFPAVSSETYFK